MKRYLLSPLVAAVALSTAPLIQAQVWQPITPAGEKSAEFTTGAVFAIPKSIAVKGGTLRMLLVSGGSGGHAPTGTCSDNTIQGGPGGDGGEVFEVDLPIQPGQCTEGLGIQIGAPGRGALRLGNGMIGEPGGDTQVTCQGVPVARALGGGKRLDPLTAARSAKGGAGGAITNTTDAVNNSSFDQRVFATHPAQAGQAGYQGYGSGGGGGAATLLTQGNAVQADSATRRASSSRVAPRGRGSNGAGNGAGPEDFQNPSSGASAENASMYGAGGGGGAQNCINPAFPRDAGHGYQGLVRIRWKE